MQKSVTAAIKSVSFHTQETKQIATQHIEMGSVVQMQALFSTNSVKKPPSSLCSATTFLGSKFSPRQKTNDRKQLTVVAAAGDVSADGTTYLLVGACTVALLGTAFPALFSRKDLCPECDGAGFVRKSGSTLRANAARKDELQIVCARCNGLGKLNQIDK